MIPLRQALNDYLTMRRALGYKLQRAEKLLTQFIEFVEGSGSERLTTNLALAWATLPAQGATDWWSARLTVVRGLRHTSAPLTRRLRYHPPNCCPGGPIARCRTSIRTRT